MQQTGRFSQQASDAIACDRIPQALRRDKPVTIVRQVIRRIAENKIRMTLDTARMPQTLKIFRLPEP
jgi:hypothetical protein